MLGLDALELDGNLLARDYIGAEIDVTKRAGANLPADAVLVTDTEILPHTKKLASDDRTLGYSMSALAGRPI